LGNPVVPPGVEHRGERVTAPPRVLHRLRAGDQVLVTEHALGRRPLAEVDDGLQARVVLEEGRHLCGEGVIDEQNGGLGLAERVDDLAGAPSDVDRVEHAIGPRHRQQVLDVSVGVERQDGDRCAIAHAQLTQPARKPSHPVGLLAIGYVAGRRKWSRAHPVSAAGLDAGLASGT
jgi:hypothetical protein